MILFEIPLVIFQRQILIIIQKSWKKMCFSHLLNKGKRFFSSNQKTFNNLRIEFDTVFNVPDLPQRPSYVNDSKIGIIASSVEVAISKIPREGERFFSKLQEFELALRIKLQYTKFECHFINLFSTLYIKLSEIKCKS